MTYILVILILIKHASVPIVEAETDRMTSTASSYAGNSLWPFNLNSRTTPASQSDNNPTSTAKPATEKQKSETDKMLGLLSLASVMNNGNIFGTMGAMLLNQMMMTSMLGLQNQMTPQNKESEKPQAKEAKLEGKKFRSRRRKKGGKLRSLLASALAERLLEKAFGMEGDGDFESRDGLCSSYGEECMPVLDCSRESGFSCGHNSVCCKQSSRFSFSFNSGNRYIWGDSDSRSSSHNNVFITNSRRSRRRRKNNKKRKNERKLNTKAVPEKAKVAKPKKIKEGKAVKTAEPRMKLKDVMRLLQFMNSGFGGGVSVEKDANGGLYIDGSKYGGGSYSGTVHLGDFEDWDFNYNSKK